MPILLGMKSISTAEVVKIIGVNRRTLYRWLYSGKIPEPKRGYLAGRDFRIWTPRDVERVKKYKAAHYRKGRGRKKKVALRGKS